MKVNFIVHNIDLLLFTLNDLGFKQRVAKMVHSYFFHNLQNKYCTCIVVGDSIIKEGGVRIPLTGLTLTLFVIAFCVFNDLYVLTVPFVEIGALLTITF